MYQIDITKYLEGKMELETFGVSDEETFDELIWQIEIKFGDSKINWDSFLNRIKTKKYNVYEVDLMKKTNTRVWSMVKHHEFINNTEIVSFLRSNTK